MREIKFRGYDPINNKMLFANIYETDEMSNWVAWENPVDSPTNTGVNFDIDQFTGLTDKNGVDIYESDVIDVHYNYIGKVVVKFKDGRFNAVDFCLAKCEVIGNIHQDKELLV